MSSYDFLLESQSTTLDAIKRINENFKKDGPTRKSTLEYHDERLIQLEGLWSDFKKNDIQLALFEGDKSGAYYEKRVYDRLEQLYEETKIMINKSRQRVLAKIEEEQFSSFGHLKQQGECSETAQQVQEKSPEQHDGNEITDGFRHVSGNVRVVDQRVTDIMNEQRSNIKAFERAVRNMDIENLKEKWQLEDKLRTVTQRWERVDSTYWKLDNILDDTQAFESDYNRLERLYEFSKEQINKRIWENKHQEKSAPKIELPVFSGSYAQWTTFKDLFVEIVHNNTFISNAQKMQHLKSKLKGEPERLIQHMNISADNYESCWQILQQRYDNKRLLFTYQANILLNQPNIQTPTASQLKRMHDTTIESMQAIKNLQFDTSTWDPLVVHILMQKLDSDTSLSFKESLNDPRGMPTLTEFLKFIENKFMSMESSTNRSRIINNQQHNIQTKTVHNAIYNKSKMQQQNGKVETKNTPKTFHYKKTLHNYIITCPKCNKQHGLYNCREFLSMSPDERLKTANDLQVCINCLFSHNGEKCTSEKKCKHCEEPHSSILHEAIESAKSKPSKSRVGQRLNTHLAHDSSNEVLLATAQVKTMTHDGTTIILRALLDQGSQVSLITENAAQRLQLKRDKLSAVVSGVGASANTKCKGLLHLQCQGIYNNYNINVNALIMKSITNKLPSKTVDKDNFEHIQHLQLADPDFNISQEIDLLLGADVYAEIVLEGLIKTKSSSIIAQQTQLGWVVCGNYKTFNCHVIVNNIQDLAQFWEQESLQENKEDIDSNNKCEQFYTETTTRLPDGRYQVRLPLKDNFIEQLGTSKSQAIAQFQQLERKMAKNLAFACEYNEFMREYEEMGHMKQVDNNKHTDMEYFLPHHGVVQPGAITTKLRVVFNASEKTSTKQSLNDLMEAGPNLQKDILSILLKWRQYKYVLTSDIEKMYRFIAVHPEHQSLQKIVWRNCPRQKLREYELCTVTYGTKAAPFLALRTLQQLALDEGDMYPEAKHILLNNFFVDDALFGKNTLDEAKHARDQLIKLLQKGGFNLRKWSSNNHRLLADLPEHMVSPVGLNFTDASASKALGLAWDPKHDQFIFSPTLKTENKNNSNKNTSKRQILSDIATIFDPLGLLSPITVKAKILFQQIWRYNIEWDDAIPDELEKEWKTYKYELLNMQPFHINRWLGIETNIEYELHAFCNASEKAFSCVVYSKVREIITQKHRIALVAAKTKVAPIKQQQTLPRLELCGAQLLAQLVKKIKQCLNKPNIKVTAWTDSMIVIGWLNGDISRWKAYVGNRVQEITSIVPAEQWKHVRSEQNPADCASRGLLPSQLHNFPLWFDGPKWLHNEEIPEMIPETIITPEIEVKRVHAVISKRIENQDNIITRLLLRNSCLMTTIRVVAWVSRFITNTSRNKCLGEAATTTMNHNVNNKNCNLTLADIQRAHNIIIKQVQSEHFEQEIKDLKTKGKLCNTSGILKLTPYLDENNILRVGGRLRYSTLSEETKHPIIIPKTSRLTHLLIDRAHATTLHGGARLTLATLRQRYWIIGGNNTIKKHLQNCVKCCRFKPAKHNQLMADLPSERITQSPPFYHTGVDFTGFVNVKLNKGRGVKTSKGYVVVFVCMTTKAVHLELASDLSSETFLLALNRMIGRRGCPKHIYSDNGTNFVGAEKELAKQLQIMHTFNNNSLSRKYSEMGITWHFNAPSWPTAGGLWEAAVKSMKYHLKRVLGEQRLTYEEFLTLLTQIEACMNSRPLCPLTEDVEDIDYLTPSHFLIGRPATFLPHENISEQNINIQQRWQLVTKMHQGFWKKWSSEYLQQLQLRSKWLHKTENFAIGDIVLIKEDNLPPAKWSLGRIQDTHPGKDNLTRVVTMKTKTGLLTRPITKLIKLPIPEAAIKIPDNTSIKPTLRVEHKPTTKNSAHKKRFKANKISSSLLCMFITLLTLFQPTRQTSNVITVTPFEPHRAIYFDRIGNLQSVHDDWKIVTYYNMTSYWQGMENIHKVVKHLEERCKQFSYQTMCKTITTEFEQELNELDHNNYMLETHHGQIRGRVTRGLINGVGYLANSLFGVLDERFVTQYKQDIEILHNDRDHLLNLIKGQTSIIEAQNNILKRNEEAMNTQFSLISKHLNITDNYLRTLGDSVQENEDLNYFNIMAVMTSIITSKLRHIQHMLLDTATNIHHGHVDTRLLPQSQLFQELNIISGQLPQHLSIPIDNIQTQLADVYKLLEVKSRLMDNYFIIEITLPLTGDTQFALYQPVPIPIITNSKDSLIMKTSSKYVAVNIRKETYMQLTGSDLEHCIKIEPSTFVCSLNKPTRNMRSHRIPCEIGAITNITLSKCIYASETCNNKWTPLQKPNTWIYVCCEECQLQIYCEGHGMSSKVIHSTGIIEAKEGCIIRNNEDTYYTQVNYSNNIYVDPEIPLINQEDINNLTSVQPLNLSSGQQNTKFVKNNYEQIHNSLKELKEETKLTEMSQHDVHQYIVSYTSLGLLVLAVVAAGGAYAYCKRGNSAVTGVSTRVPPPKPQRATSRRLQTATEDIEMHTMRNATYATPHAFNI